MSENDRQEARDSHGLFLFQSAKAILGEVLDLVFPPRCRHCGQVDTHFCDACIDLLMVAPLSIIHTEMSPLVQILSSGAHQGILQAAVQALKYEGQQHLGILLAKRLQMMLSDEDWPIDTVIPVPLHTKRLQQRGYNQANIIAHELAKQLDIYSCDICLIRETHTPSQVGLSRLERIENVREAFRATNDDLVDRHILLVDDVRTTGATLAACATALMDFGVASVYAVTVTAAEYA